jgi:DNA repair protein RecO (recombination protein O)
MIEKTSGIVLHSFKYGETSVIARVFTRNKGLQAYIVPGVRKARSKTRNNLFQPLTILDMVVYHKENSGLQHIKEVHCPQPYMSIPYDILKSSVAIFLSEMLTHAIKEHDAHPDMFDYIRESLTFLDETTDKTADFHLVFLMQLSRFLGIQPRNNYTEKHGFFNLGEGLFQSNFGGDQSCLDKNLSASFHQINSISYRELQQLQFNQATRRSLLTTIINYYRIHLQGFQEVRSQAVLEMVLS